jgi:uncharacterized protein YndB with AHSA1/START domain
MNELAEYILDREFDAPREMVWRAWTEPELLSHWYGPGVETIVHKFDLKPGGLWLGEMKWGDKSDFSRVTFQEVAMHERLVWHHSSSDSDWNIITSPMMANWPRVILTSVSFEELGSKTKLRLTMAPLDASEAEIASFASGIAGMSKGWGGGFAMMDEMFVEMLAENT